MATERLIDRTIAERPRFEVPVAEPPSERMEQMLDDALAATFPCSDPVSTLCAEYEPHKH